MFKTKFARNSEIESLKEAEQKLLTQNNTLKNNDIKSTVFQNVKSKTFF